MPAARRGWRRAISPHPLTPPNMPPACSGQASGGCLAGVKLPEIGERVALGWRDRRQSQSWDEDGRSIRGIVPMFLVPLDKDTVVDWPVAPPGVAGFFLGVGAALW